MVSWWKRGNTIHNHHYTRDDTWNEFLFHLVPSSRPLTGLQTIVLVTFLMKRITNWLTTDTLSPPFSWDLRVWVHRSAGTSGLRFSLLSLQSVLMFIIKQLQRFILILLWLYYDKRGSWSLVSSTLYFALFSFFHSFKTWLVRMPTTMTNYLIICVTNKIKSLRSLTKITFRKYANILWYAHNMIIVSQMHLAFGFAKTYKVH